MTRILSDKYKVTIAWFLYFIFFVQMFFPLHVAGSVSFNKHIIKGGSGRSMTNSLRYVSGTYKKVESSSPQKAGILLMNPNTKSEEKKIDLKELPDAGPVTPEATSFKSIGTDNLVNLFTGDFSYSIPLLDVGGYPVNLFYNAGVTMDQEAGWAGLGWNINPGTVTRNLRGVPDDFNGSDMLIQTQNVKPNRTWGGEVGVDGEILGIKKVGMNLSLGFSYNNYLGPELDVGAGISIPIANLKAFKFEKSASENLGVSLGAGVKLSSRSGLTFSPSLNARMPMVANFANTGVGLNTSYNSRTGIKSLTLYSEMSFYHTKGVKELKTSIESNYGGTSFRTAASTISFSKPSYLPILRMPMENTTLAGQLELGGGIFGFRGSVTGNGYYTESKIPKELQVISRPLVGYIYSENAGNDKNAVMDFNRVNDAEITPNTPVISAPVYTYDVFTIQGEGTGGSIRAYRGDIGYMKDNETVSKDNSTSIGFDIAPPGHFGGNWNSVSTPTRAGDWEDANNTLKQTMQFKGPRAGSFLENVYFKNPGEATVVNEQTLKNLGYDDLVSFRLSGSGANVRLESRLEKYNKISGNYKEDFSIAGATSLSEREKRSQVITILTGSEASETGLEREIRNYSGAFGPDNMISYTKIDRQGGFRKAHHISEIDVLEQNGMRYIYGIPVYNVVQKDFAFSVNKEGDYETGLVNFDPIEASLESPALRSGSKLDGYFQVQETPAYASSFLLTALLSPDYVDVTGDGITEDDLGNAVKFNYTKMDELVKWRTPRNNDNAATAFYNEGLKSEKKDDKAIFSYGEREAWYLNSIESKSMIAIFSIDDRNDARNVKSEMDGGVDILSNVSKKLSRIDLYTKAEINAKGIEAARPLKSVFFVYDYSLCKGIPDNPNANEGKLTLKAVYFTYNGQDRQSKEKYVFDYNESSPSDNPHYAFNASDKWGTYKNPEVNIPGLSNADYPYTTGDKVEMDKFACAWSLKKILLPSGGQMEIEYEADDFAYTQNRRAANMFNIYGLGNSENYFLGNAMYNGPGTDDNFYIYVELDQALENSGNEKIREEIFSKYLEGMNQLAFKVQVQMPKGPEFLTVYSSFDDYGLCPNSTSKKHIYIRLKPLDGKSPLAVSAIGFLTENLPGQAFKGYEAEINNLPDFINLAGTMLASLTTAFKNVHEQMREGFKARSIVLNKSFVRLNNPDKVKYGGGVRVKKIVLKDNWNKMTGQYDSEYGQEYDYTTVENIAGRKRIISSGVAAYEPSIGSEENPFREILQVKNKLPAASAQYGAIEMPVLEGLFPAPSVGYSKVSVRSIHRKGTHGNLSLRSAVGKQVTRFYTAKDFPVHYNYTPLRSEDYHKSPPFTFFFKQVIDRRTVSQGFLVETNDMHGKIRSQEAFSESDEVTPLSGSYHYYKNTGKNGLNDKVDFIFNDLGGGIRKGNMGIDIELMTDVRKFSVKSNGLNRQAQVDLFPIIFPFFIPTVFLLNTYVENTYRAVSTTKLVNYRAIQDSVVVMDKGSVVSSKPLAYDAETGIAVVSQTVNEFNDPVYSVSYPAYWAYSGMSPAYKNISREFKNINFYDGKISLPDQDNIFESGDELYITQQGSGSTGCISSSPDVRKLWVYDKKKDTSSFTQQSKDLIFLDSTGNLFTKSGVSFKIIRSGRRNLLNNTVSTLTTLANPIHSGKLIIDGESKVVEASATEYKEKWQIDNDMISKRVYYQSCSGIELDSLSCDGILEKKINPYQKGLIGNFKPYRSYNYYGERNQTDIAIPVYTRKTGFLPGFTNYWNFDSFFKLIPLINHPNWVWNSELTRVNSKGQEIEMKDALNRYSSVQFGFNKNLAVSTVSNAKFGLSFFEGFEDFAYRERINPDPLLKCSEEYIDFSKMSNSKIVNTDATGLNAHTGDYILRIDGNSIGEKTIGFKTPTDSFRMYIEKGYLLKTPDYGFISKSLGNCSIAHTGTFSNPSPFLSFSTQGSFDGPISCMDSALVEAFIDIKKSGNYYVSTEKNITINVFDYPQDPRCHCGTDDGNCVIPTHTADAHFTFLEISNKVYDLSNNLIASTSENGEMYLPKGIYKIKYKIIYSYYIETLKEWYCLWGNPIPYSIGSEIQASLYFNYIYKECDPFGEIILLNKTLDIANTCAYSQPIKASDSMFNNNFSLTPGDKMLFSAWVRESCVAPCDKTSYNDNKVELQFSGAPGNTVTIKPTGNIIEGWQKIEGEFTVPAGASSMSLHFINNSSEDSYYDDIRIHPFNANMKSYVYDSENLRLRAELDENNFAAFYEYDEEGQLVRVKKETVQGVKTIQETRSAKQTNVQELE